MTPAELAELRRQKILARSGQRLQKIVSAAKPEDKTNDNVNSGGEDIGSDMKTPESQDQSASAAPSLRDPTPEHTHTETKKQADKNDIAEGLLDDLLDEAAGKSLAEVPDSKSPKQKGAGTSALEDDDGSVPLTPLSSVAASAEVRKRASARKSDVLDDVVNDTMAALNAVPGELRNAMNDFLGSPSGQNVSEMASQVSGSMSHMEQDLNNMLGGLAGGGGGLLGAMMNQQMNAMLGGGLGGAAGGSRTSAAPRASTDRAVPSQGTSSQPAGRMGMALADPFLAGRRVVVIIVALLLAFQMFGIADAFNGSWVFAFAMVETAAFLIRFAIAPPKYPRHPLLESFNLGFLSAIPSFFSDIRGIITDFSVFLFVSMLFYEGLTPLWMPAIEGEGNFAAGMMDTTEL